MCSRDLNQSKITAATFDLLEIDAELADAPNDQQPIHSLSNMREKIKRLFHMIIHAEDRGDHSFLVRNDPIDGDDDPSYSLIQFIMDDIEDYDKVKFRKLYITDSKTDAFRAFASYIYYDHLEDIDSADLFLIAEEEALQVHLKAFMSN